MAKRQSLSFLLAPALLWFTGCTVGPDYEPPEPEMPAAWQQELADGLEASAADLREWWQALGDPVLARMIDRAIAGNLDLQAALVRLEEARALRGIEEGAYFPDIDGVGSYSRNRASEESETGKANKRAGGSTDAFNDWYSGFDLTWELDLFGRIRRSVEAAYAEYEAFAEDYRALRVVLLAEVALNYIDLRTFQLRLQIAEKNLESQAGSYEIAKARFDAEISPELDVAQAESNLANTRTEIPLLRMGARRALNRLAVLLGEHPGALVAELDAPAELPAIPEQIAVGTPAALLRQRPDIRRSERQLAAATARIGAAEAERWPVFFLNGTIGLNSNNTGDFMRHSAHTYSFGPGFRWNLFDGWRVENNIAAFDAQARQVLLGFQQNVLVALEEVENSLVSLVEERERTVRLTEAEDASSRVVGFVQVRYKEGLTDFQNVLDAQRTLFRVQDNLASSRGQALVDLILLYRSLGGGWDVGRAVGEPQP